jgi:hypothetical protein
VSKVSVFRRPCRGVSHKRTNILKNLQTQGYSYSDPRCFFDIEEVFLDIIEQDVPGLEPQAEFPVEPVTGHQAKVKVTGDTERNLFFLKCAEDWWNRELDRNGEVSMYEVLKYLQYRFDIEKEGLSDKEYRDRMTFLRNYGWRKGCGGDDFVDFGLYRAINEPAIARKSDIVYIEFNCDGNLENLTELNIEKWR